MKFITVLSVSMFILRVLSVAQNNEANKEHNGEFDQKNIAERSNEELKELLVRDKVEEFKDDFFIQTNTDISDPIGEDDWDMDIGETTLNATVVNDNESKGNESITIDNQQLLENFTNANFETSDTAGNNTGTSRNNSDAPSVEKVDVTTRKPLWSALLDDVTVEEIFIEVTAKPQPSSKTTTETNKRVTEMNIDFNQHNKDNFKHGNLDSHTTIKPSNDQSYITEYFKGGLQSTTAYPRPNNHWEDKLQFVPIAKELTTQNPKARAKSDKHQNIKGGKARSRNVYVYETDKDDDLMVANKEEDDYILVKYNSGTVRVKRSLEDYISGSGSGSGALAVRGELWISPVVSGNESINGTSENNKLKQRLASSLKRYLCTYIKRMSYTPLKFSYFDVHMLKTRINYTIVEFEIFIYDSVNEYDNTFDFDVRMVIAKALVNMKAIESIYDVVLSQLENVTDVLQAAMCITCKSYEICEPINSYLYEWHCKPMESRTYPYGVLSMDGTLPKNKEFATVKIYIEDFIPFENTLYQYLWISVNGLISFGDEFSSFTPQLLPVLDKKGKPRPLLAPYWTDLELTDGDEGQVYYHVYNCCLETSSSKVCEQANIDVVRYLVNASSYNATTVIVITWVKVPAPGNNSNERVSFQCIIITDGYTTYAMYLYMQAAMQFKPLSARSVEIGWGKYNLDTSRSAYYMFDQVLGNTGSPGQWFFKVGEKVNYKMMCRSWYQTSPIAEYCATERKKSEMPACPCNELVAINSPLWVSYSRIQNDSHCFDLLPYYGEYGRRCCYRTDGSFSLETRRPQAGSLQRYNAFNSLIHNSKDHHINDIEPKNWCCYQSNLCELYYVLRPNVQCIASSWSRAFLFGDPHIITFDERFYIFNGLGEYKILEVNGIAMDKAEINFIMQGRTCAAFNSNGTKTRAAVWCGFVFKSGDENTLSVEVSPSREMMIIYGNKRDYSAQFQNEHEFFAMENGMVIRKQNGSLTVSFGESVGATVSLIYGFLEVSVSLDKKYQNMTRGLLGNFNGIKTDEFFFQNGSKLFDESSERQIFQFVQSWALTQSESLFQYAYGQNTSTFSYPNNNPLFYDDLDETITNNFNTLCNGTFKIPCIYDYIATLNESLAKHSLTVADQFIVDSINMANQGPLIKLNQTHFEVYRNKPFYLNASGFDIDGNITHFIVLTNVNYTETQHEQSTATHNATSSFRFIVTDLIPVTIGITAVDDNNLQSEVIPLSLTLCTGCSNQGSCNFSVTRPTTSPYFSYATCNCKFGHEGAECEEVSDGCASNPCPLGCVNITNNLEQENGISYNCVNCPVGFNLSIAKTKCADFDECQTSPCDSFADCENTFGSFVCHCPKGYQNNNNTCVDIDECANKLDNCDQICINMPGKFNCSCFSGYKRTNNTCVEIKTDKNQCKSLNKTCEYGCNDTQGCFCKRGYNLTQDGIHCEDVDECKENICSQNCSNSVGSFTCSCHPGYKINSKDAHKCDSCPDNMYGLNCASQCECKGHALRCDSIKGCICQDNWKGTNCDIDVDECVETPDICPADHYCTNTQGSYTCDCPTGFEDMNGTCINVNECNNILLSKCSQSCIDIPGYYICDCFNGFTKQSIGTCKDIDECDNGQSGCEQICLNVPGSSYCGCYPGYRLKDDRKTCEKDAVDPCINSNLSCSHGCTVINGTAQCFCNIGFILSTNNFECIATTNTSRNACINYIKNYQEYVECLIITGKTTVTMQTTTTNTTTASVQQTITTQQTTSPQTTSTTKPTSTTTIMLTTTTIPQTTTTTTSSTSKPITTTTTTKPTTTIPTTTATKLTITTFIPTTTKTTSTIKQTTTPTKPTTTKPTTTTMKSPTTTVKPTTTTTKSSTTIPTTIATKLTTTTTIPTTMKATTTTMNPTTTAVKPTTTTTKPTTSIPTTTATKLTTSTIKPTTTTFKPSTITTKKPSTIVPTTTTTTSKLTTTTTIPTTSKTTSTTKPTTTTVKSTTTTTKPSTAIPTTTATKLTTPTKPTTTKPTTTTTKPTTTTVKATTTTTKPTTTIPTITATKLTTTLTIPTTTKPTTSTLKPTTTTTKPSSTIPTTTTTTMKPPTTTVKQTTTITKPTTTITKLTTTTTTPTTTKPTTTTMKSTTTTIKPTSMTTKSTTTLAKPNTTATKLTTTTIIPTTTKTTTTTKQTTTLVKPSTTTTKPTTTIPTTTTTKLTTTTTIPTTTKPTITTMKPTTTTVKPTTTTTKPTTAIPNTTTASTKLTTTTTILITTKPTTTTMKPTTTTVKPTTTTTKPSTTIPTTTATTMKPPTTTVKPTTTTTKPTTTITKLTTTTPTPTTTKPTTTTMKSTTTTIKPTTMTTKSTTTLAKPNTTTTTKLTTTTIIPTTTKTTTTTKQTTTSVKPTTTTRKPATTIPTTTTTKLTTTTTIPTTTKPTTTTMKPTTTTVKPTTTTTKPITAIPTTTKPTTTTAKTTTTTMKPPTTTVKPTTTTTKPSTTITKLTTTTTTPTTIKPTTTTMKSTTTTIKPTTLTTKSTTNLAKPNTTTTKPTTTKMKATAFTTKTTATTTKQTTTSTTPIKAIGTTTSAKSTTATTRPTITTKPMTTTTKSI